MMRTTGKRLILEPILEQPSASIVVPNRTSRWKNGAVSICGRVVAMGRENAGIDLGDIVYHSDSCGRLIADDQFNVIHEDDVMFVSKEFIPVQWVGAEEIPDGI